MARSSTRGRGQDGVAAQEVHLDLHGIAEPAENIDVVPTFFIITARRIIVNADLVVEIAVFVYGSVAREEETAQSDLDLMIAGEAELDEILSRLSDVEGTLGRAANPTVYSAKEFKAKIARGNHFVKRGHEGQESIFDWKRA